MLTHVTLFRGGRILWLTGLLLAASLLFANPALAAPPPDDQSPLCLECHEAEVSAWESSPHAMAATGGQTAATCQNCHGPYVEDHPDAGLMKLTVNSAACQDCHSNTFGQWQNSQHAAAGTECISCHLSHSQEFRLTDDKRCTTCHQNATEVVAHSTHGLANVACTDCHISAVKTTSNLTFISSQPQLAPDHDFIHVSNANCLNCHTADAHSGLPPIKGEQVAQARLVSQAESVPALTAHLQAIEQSNWILSIMTPVALGLGIGVGGILGVGLMLGLSAIQRRQQ